MFLTKEVIKKVGGYDERFGLYGFEHSNYSKRIFMSGLNNMGEYLCPLGTNKYLYAMDLDHSRKEEFQNKVKHKPSMDIRETIYSIEKAQQIFSEPITEIFISL